jgi:hypothetical protein
MNPNDEWADMKTGWQATSVGETFLTEKLRWSLRLRMIGSWAWLLLEVVSAVLLLVLAAVQVKMGQIGVAAALTALTLASVGASIWARRSPLRSAKGSLRDLIELTIQRARRSERFAWAQYLTVAACMAYVLAMYYSDVGDPQAAYHDAGRVVAAMITFVVYAGGVAIYHRYARRRARRFADLRASFLKPDSL